LSIISRASYDVNNVKDYCRTVLFNVLGDHLAKEIDEWSLKKRGLFWCRQFGDIKIS